MTARHCIEHQVLVIQSHEWTPADADQFVIAEGVDCLARHPAVHSNMLNDGLRSP